MQTDCEKSCSHAAFVNTYFTAATLSSTSRIQGMKRGARVRQNQTKDIWWGFPGNCPQTLLLKWHICGRNEAAFLLNKHHVPHLAEGIQTVPVCLFLTGTLRPHNRPFILKKTSVSISLGLAPAEIISVCSCQGCSSQRWVFMVTKKTHTKDTDTFSRAETDHQALGG